MTLFGEIVRQGRGWLPLMVFCSLTGAGVTLALPVVLGSVLDAAIAGDATTKSLIVAASLIGLVVVTDLVESYAGVTCVAGTAAWLRQRTLRHLFSLSPQRLQTFDNGDLVSRVSGNAVDAAQAGTSLAVVAVGAVAPVGSLVLLALIDPWTALALLAGVGLVALVLKTFTRRTSAVAASYQQAQGAIAARLAEALGGIRTIGAAATVEQERDRILRPLPELGQLGRRIWTVLGRASAQAAVAGPVVLVAVLAVGGLALTSGRISPGELFAAGRYAVMGAGLGGLTGVLSAYARARAGSRRVAEVLAQPTTTYGTRHFPDDRPRGGELVFSKVSVTGLLHDLDLTIPAGAAVAVVGHSGSGKSVLAELAARLRDPDSGRVCLDGIALTELTHDELRTAVGCAFERPNLVGETVGAAIGFGRDQASITRAARAVHAHDFVARLPFGYGTPLAKAPMSGGERQRLGLARAWHAQRLLVLDDATSSLDMVTEMKIGEALLRDRDRTRLIITHRRSTAARADLVLWLDQGHLRALAPHHLLWSDPHYRAVWQ